VAYRTLSGKRKMTTNIVDNEGLTAALRQIKQGMVRNRLANLFLTMPKGKVTVKMWFDKETPRALAERYTLSDHCSPLSPRDADVLINKSA
jgi:hypothetical protein